MRLLLFCFFSNTMVITLQWLEAEILRLTHLRDRASEKGRKKEYPLYNCTNTCFSW